LLSSPRFDQTEKVKKKNFVTGINLFNQSLLTMGPETPTGSMGKQKSS
jgi:hypothetical protein